MAVNLKGKLINWSTGDSLTSSPRSRLCSLTLGKNLPRAPERRDQKIQWWTLGRREKEEETPPHSLFWPSSHPFISLIMSVCQRKGGVIKKKEPEQEETFKSQTGVKCINSDHSVRYTNTNWVLHSNRIVWSLEGMHRLYTNSTEAGHTLGKSTHCANMGRGLSLLSQTCKPTGTQKQQTPALSLLTHTGLLSSLSIPFTHISMMAHCTL